MLLFLFLACAGLFLTLHVPVGLDQELAMPKVGTARGQQGVPGHLGTPGDSAALYGDAHGQYGTVLTLCRDPVAP